jgi:drug/metabolite transporter (DMT)-like permease
VGTGVVLLGEELGPLTLVGAVMVLAGVWVVTRKA